MKRRTVLIVAYPGLQSLDAVGPFEVFSAAGQVAEHLGEPTRYVPVLVSLTGGPVTAESGLQLGTTRWADAIDSVRFDTLLIPGGNGVEAARGNRALVARVATAARRARRVATVCSGTFLAAEAGLLDGRRVTTHWSRAKQLAADYPQLQVDPDPIYIRDGKYWSSAGVTAGIDLALALVEQDCGTQVAQTVARLLVMFLHRPGGQSQFASAVWVPRAERSSVRAAQARIESEPADDHSLPTLARAAAMSVRHFARVFRDEVGVTPARYVEQVRVEAARRELEQTDHTLDVVAARCGIGSAETLRRVFIRRLNVTPEAYRRRFALSPSSERSSA
jgi:transcriptional regulator GlxA family with amidase domain